MAGGPPTVYPVASERRIAGSARGWSRTLHRRGPFRNLKLASGWIHGHAAWERPWPPSRTGPRGRRRRRAPLAHWHGQSGHRATPPPAHSMAAPVPARRHAPAVHDGGGRLVLVGAESVGRNQTLRLGSALLTRAGAGPGPVQKSGTSRHVGWLEKVTKWRSVEIANA